MGVADAQLGSIQICATPLEAPVDTAVAPAHHPDIWAAAMLHDPQLQFRQDQ